MRRRVSTRHLLMTLGILMMAGGLIALVSYKAGAHSQPRCPAEDSCTADYYEGAWHITPATPDVSHITGTTRRPTCQELAREYGDDGLCAGGN